jgi:aromatic ring-opening dioxygenase catalytic subunit (LigB family)
VCIFETFQGKFPDYLLYARMYKLTRRTEYKPRALFISHGGGPLPLLGDAGHRELVECLAGIASEIARPAAIIVVSAHWEEYRPTVTSGAAPALIYDYAGFPQQSYKIRYPCPGEPALAREIRKTLGDSGIQSALDANRGFDHGLFVPLKIMYPEADIPCVQLSLVSTLDPVQHIAIGRALRALHLENILLIGSGFSFHNMKAFFRTDNHESRALNHSFEKWLLATCCTTDYPEEQRTQQLANWIEAPGARFCHPREEHLLPLHVCYGLAQAPCSASFELQIMNKKSSMYLW